jgi:hypothetical protein
MASTHTKKRRRTGIMIGMDKRWLIYMRSQQAISPFVGIESIIWIRRERRREDDQRQHVALWPPSYYGSHDAQKCIAIYLKMHAHVVSETEEPWYIVRARAVL